MHDRNWERVAGFAGLAAVVLFVVPAFAGAGTPPKPGDPDSAYKGYLLAHHAAEMRSVWLQAFGAVLVVWLGSGIRSALRHHDPDSTNLATTVYGAFVAAAVMLAVGSAVTGGLIYKGLAGVTPAMVRVIWDTNAFTMGVTLGLVTAVAASLIAVAALAARAMPAYVGVASVASAVVNLAGALAFFSTRGFFSIEGGIWIVGLVVTMLWLISLSVALIRPAVATAGAATPVVPVT